MRSVTAINPLEESPALLSRDFSGTKLHSKKYNHSPASYLYHKHEEEPDFDCEFLSSTAEYFLENDYINNLEP